jgi:hypothetical protein
MFTDQIYNMYNKKNCSFRRYISVFVQTVYYVSNISRHLQANSIIEIKILHEPVVPHALGSCLFNVMYLAIVYLNTFKNYLNYKCI